MQAHPPRDTPIQRPKELEQELGRRGSGMWSQLHGCPCAFLWGFICSKGLVAL